VAKLGEMECGQFVGKVKPDRQIERLAVRFKLDSRVVSRLTELRVRRARTKGEDFDRLEQHLMLCKRPSATATLLIGKLLEGELRQIPDVTSAKAIAQKFKLDKDAKSKLREIAEKRADDIEEVMEHIEKTLQMSHSPSATLCKIAKTLMDGAKRSKLEDKYGKDDSGSDREGSRGRGSNGSESPGRKSDCSSDSSSIRRRKAAGRSRSRSRRKAAAKKKKAPAATGGGGGCGGGGGSGHGAPKKASAPKPGAVVTGGGSGGWTVVEHKPGAVSAGMTLWSKSGLVRRDGALSQYSSEGFRNVGSKTYLLKTKSGDALVAKETHEQTEIGTSHFLAEFNKMKELQHPHCIKVVELVIAQDLVNGDWRDHVYVISEFAAGSDLLSFMKKLIDMDVEITEEWVAGVFVQAMRGVAYLHDNGIVHNDLKPDNILCMEAFNSGDSGRVPWVPDSYMFVQCTSRLMAAVAANNAVKWLLLFRLASAVPSWRAGLQRCTWEFSFSSTSMIAIFRSGPQLRGSGVQGYQVESELGPTWVCVGVRYRLTSDDQRWGEVSDDLASNRGVWQLASGGKAPASWRPSVLEGGGVQSPR
ncbi:unnamed protein product, partial [Polarella glacialis]